MLTKKNQVRNCSLTGLVFLTSLLFLTSCTPAGPRALLKGKRQLEKGRYAEALEQFKTATSLLPTNALAWHYYGLAAQGSGLTSEAEKAYTTALTLDRDLVEARFNLGSLLLDANRPEEAKTQLTTYNLRRGNTAEGLARFGTAQLRLRDSAGAEKSFTESLRLDPKEEEALNGLGMVRLQRGRPTEAAQLFASALKQDPGYAPALLNLAIVRHQYLRDPQAALQTYQEYLALKPAPPQAASVSAIVAQLQQEFARREPAATPTKTQPAPPPATTPAVRQAAEPLVPTQTAQSASNVAPPRTSPGSAVAQKPSPFAQKTSPPPPQTSNVAETKPQPARASNVPSAQIERVTLPPEQSVKVARDVTPAETPTVAEQQRQAPGSAAPKRGFFQKLNPLNLLGGANKSAGSVPAPTTTGSKPEVLAAGAKENTRAAGARYAYRYPMRPTPGDRQSAQAAFENGVQLQAAKNLPQAVEAYRKATQTDPAFFEAYYNMGLALGALGKFQPALLAYENALAARPNSLEARYNLALTLGQAGYPVDSAAEFDTVLMSHPNEVRAHLALGNLYAQQLKDPARAREHYAKVIELDPNHPQAAAIKQYLNRRP